MIYFHLIWYTGICGITSGILELSQDFLKDSERFLNKIHIVGAITSAIEAQTIQTVMFIY